MKLAAIQMNSQEDWQANMAQALLFVNEAAAAGAKLIALPENVLVMAKKSEDLFLLPLLEMRDTYLTALQGIASKYDCKILAGTIPFPIESQKKLYNRAYLVEGGNITHYDKIHLCDITLSDGQSLNESKNYQYGDKAVVAGNIGLTICYDVRFPHLFRTLAKQSAEIIAVPSAFTKPTGEAHWHTLLRARAIENGCYIIAPAQTGNHPANRQTYGHALIVDPWGHVIADAGEDIGIAYADFDSELVRQVRQKVPSLLHDRAIVLQS
jgi:predicted amidohydrolase